MEQTNDIKMHCDVPALWLEHKDGLLHFIRKRVADPQTADDISQEVLMKVYKFCMAKSGVGNVRAWLFQIAQNTITDHFRKQQKMSANLPELAIESEDKIFAEASEYIRPMLSFLPENYAVPLLLSDIEGIKQADIAVQLGLTLAATKSRIQRARQLLKEQFVICCHFETDKFGNLTDFKVKENCTPLQKIILEKI
jgi:RNA polymerase sigma-70 factor (ECF subfamily)